MCKRFVASACSAQTLPSPGRDIAPHESHDTPRRRAGRARIGPAPDRRPVARGPTTAVARTAPRRADGPTHGPPPGRTGARGPADTAPDEARLRRRADPPRRGRRDVRTWSLSRIGRVQEIGRSSRRSGRRSSRRAATRPSCGRRRSAGPSETTGTRPVSADPVTAAVAGRHGGDRPRPAGATAAAPSGARRRPTAGDLGGLGGAATAGRRASRRSRARDDGPRTRTAPSRPRCGGRRSRRQVGHDGQVPHGRQPRGRPGHRRPRTGRAGRTGAGPPTSPAWRARGRPPRAAPPTGGAPAGAGWRGRSRPSPRRRRGRRGPTPGRTRRHRAASRAARPPTRLPPDRPRRPGADS